jgi:hypothetical protein
VLPLVMPLRVNLFADLMYEGARTVTGPFGARLARRRLAAALLLAGLAGCGGGGATAPTLSATLTGNWAGNITYQTGTSTSQENFRMSLVQAGGGTVTGTYQAERFAGNITGQVTSGAFSGTFTYTNITGTTACTSPFTVTGPTGLSSLSWTSAGIATSDACLNPPVNMTIAVARQ